MADDYIKTNPVESVFEAKIPPGEIVYLTEKEIHLLYNSDNLLTPGLEPVADAFLFRCFTGLCYIDLKKFSAKKHITMLHGRKVIHYARTKTQTPFTIPVLTQTEELLQKYRGNIPVLSNQKMNQLIKVIAKTVGIDKYLTTHIGRKTAGTFLSNNDVPLGVISKILGEKSIKTTEKVYAHLLQETILRHIKHLGRIKKKASNSKTIYNFTTVHLFKRTISSLSMDLRKVFRVISDKFLNDFKLSSQLNHSGNIGDYRENSLREFLEVGRLPKRYGIGNGEIVGHTTSSKQSDLIIFDQLNGIPLIFSNEVQVYPIDCIYGTVEVKSKLSKTKLIEGLNNIKSVKELVPNDVLVEAGVYSRAARSREKPFGFIFAYGLDNNSLESLTNNLVEWEKQNPSETWPNLIIVLGEGIIYHTQRLEQRISSNSIDNSCRPIYISNKNDAFFYFYSYLLDLCNIELPRVKISKYLDRPQQIGKYIVGNNDRIQIADSSGKISSKQVYRLHEKCINKMVTWCKKQGKIKYGELFLLRLGQIPEDIPHSVLDQLVYFYNPENWKGMHEVPHAIRVNDGQVIAQKGVVISCDFITVDGDSYHYPSGYMTKDDIEPIPGREVDDL